MIERLLSQEQEWDDEPQDGSDGERGESLAMHAEGWCWWGGSGDDKDPEEHKPVRLPVPKAKPEVDCVVRWCCLFYDGALLTGCSSRIVSIGNMVNGIN